MRRSTSTLASALLALLVAFAGCAAPAPVPDPTAESAPVMTQLERTFQGTIGYRAGGDSAPYAQYEGDPPCAYFGVPPGTTLLRARLAWETPQDVGLEVFSYDIKYRTWVDPPAAQPTSPVELEIEAPEAGQWGHWIGPIAAGAQIPWTLTLTWSVARANATLDETIGEEGFPC